MRDKILQYYYVFLPKRHPAVIQLTQNDTEGTHYGNLHRTGAGGYHDPAFGRMAPLPAVQRRTVCPDGKIHLALFRRSGGIADGSLHRPVYGKRPERLYLQAGHVYGLSSLRNRISLSDQAAIAAAFVCDQHAADVGPVHPRGQ